jgi:hypothetical protein
VRTFLTPPASFGEMREGPHAALRTAHHASPLLGWVGGPLAPTMRAPPTRSTITISLTRPHHAGRAPHSRPAGPRESPHQPNQRGHAGGEPSRPRKASPEESLELAGDAGLARPSLPRWCRCHPDARPASPDPLVARCTRSSPTLCGCGREAAIRQGLEAATSAWSPRPRALRPLAPRPLHGLVTTVGGRALPRPNAPQIPLA